LKLAAYHGDVIFGHSWHMDPSWATRPTCHPEGAWRPWGSLSNAASTITADDPREIPHAAEDLRSEWYL